MAFSVARSAFDDWIVIRDAWFLRSLRDVIDIGAEHDHRFSLAPGRQERSRNPRKTTLDSESFLLQDAAQILRCLEFLKTKFAEAEDGIDHDLCLLLHAVNLRHEVSLQSTFFFRRDSLLTENQTRYK